MKLNQWARIQTVAILKTLSLSVFTILLPCFLIVLFWNQSSHVQSLFTANSKSLLIALQTGDLVQLEKALSGYQSDSAISSYDLKDRDGNSLSSYQAKDNHFIIFHKKLTIKSADGANWGFLSVFWTLQWILIAYFIFGALALVGVVAIVVFNAWEKFTKKLIDSIEQMQNFLNQKKMPEFIYNIEDLKNVFEKLQSIQVKEIEIEKMKAQREKEQVIIEISQKVVHDIRSPMSALSIVLSTVTLDENRKNLVDCAFKQMEEICKELLFERKKLQKPTESVHKAINQIVHETRIRHTDKELDLNLSKIAMDEIIPDHEFKSVLSNLLNNAFEAVLVKTGVVTLSSEKMANKIAIKITDNGHGIPTEILLRLGDKPLTHSKGESGNGLGFYNAKQWATRIGGNLSIRSEVGQGTEVILEIPVI